MPKGKKSSQASAASAAAAMHRAGFSASTFVGFDAFANHGVQAGGAQAAASRTSDATSGFASSFFEGSNEDLKQAFKALSKRDSQTKIKALQEVDDLVNGSSPVKKEEARVALRHFYYHYLRLCTRDADQRVRERANVTLLAFVTRVPKLVTKSSSVILGDVICCSGDSANAEVARAANAVLDALQAALAEGKHLLDGAAATTVAELLSQRVLGRAPKVGDLDQETIERLQCNALVGVANLSTRVPTEAMRDIVMTVFGKDPKQVHKLLLNHRSSAVRSKAYALEAMLANSRLLDRSDLRDSQVIEQLCKSLEKENDAAGVRQLVEAIVTFLKVLNRDQATGTAGDSSDVDFFELIGDYRKKFFPALWSLLRDAARGAGVHVYPMMLSILALVPDRVWDDFGDNVLATKFLDELWSGMSNKEQLGPHAAPCLAQAHLECVAFCLKSERDVPVEQLMGTVRHFAGETNKARVGRQLPDTIALALGQVHRSEHWEEIERSLREMFAVDRGHAERVGQILRAAFNIARIQSLCAEIVADVAHGSLPCVSIKALKAAWWTAGPRAVLAGDADRGAKIATVLHSVTAEVPRGRIDDEEAIAGWHVVIAAMQNESEDHGGGIWDELVSLGGPRYDLGTTDGISTFSKALAMLPSLLAEFGRDSKPLDRVVRAVLSNPWSSGVEALERLGWLKETAARTELQSTVKDNLEILVDDMFAVEQPTRVLAEATKRWIDIVRISPDATEEMIGMSLVLRTCKELSEGTFSESPRNRGLDTWVARWLLQRFLRSEDSDWTAVATRTWAHLAVSHGAVEAVLGQIVDTDALTTGQARLLVRLAMHISEEKNEGECLGFEEPPRLLCTLLVNGHEEHFWRDAVLVPYVLASPGRFEALVAFMLTQTEEVADGLGVLLQAGSALSDPSVLAGCVDRVLRDTLEARDLDLGLLRQLVEHTSSALASCPWKPDSETQSVLSHATEDCCEMIMRHVPEQLRATANEAADEFLANLKDLEGKVEDVPEPTTLGASTSKQEGAAGLASDLPVSSPDGARAPSFEVDEAVWYTKNEARAEGVVKAVHLDDPSAPYYTVMLVADRREVQTTAKYLASKLAKPTTLEELNKLLAAARRAGDHKESLRLMKLQPSLLPKPVDSDLVRKQASEAARRRRKVALEQLAENRRPVGSARDLSFAQGTRSEVAGAPMAKAKEQPEELRKELTRFAVLLSPLRGAKLGNDEFSALLRVAHALEGLAPPHGIATTLRFAKSEDDDLAKLLEAVLRVLGVIAGHLAIRVLPDRVRGYLERVTLSCLASGPSWWGLTCLSAEILAEVDESEPMMGRGLELVFRAVLSCEPPAAMHEPTDAMLRLLDVVGAEIVLLVEREGSESGTILNWMFQDSDRDSETISRARMALFVLFERLCKEEDDLAATWWEKRDVLQNMVSQQTSSTGQFQALAWGMLLTLIRRNLLFAPEEREEVLAALEETGLVPRALRWSLNAEVEDDWAHRHVAVKTLRVLPALSRKWFMDGAEVKRAEFAAIQKLLTQFVSPDIIHEELEGINAANKAHAFDVVSSVSAGESAGEVAGDADEDGDVGQISVSTSKVARAVTALYEKEDCEVEITFVLPPTFPMEQVDIQCTRQVGIKKEKMRRWVLEIDGLLSTRGSLLDAIMIWKINMDKEFQGIEPCPICYTVLHVTDQSLPKLVCSTCKNGFHSRCLVKWFKTSHKNDCPLCKQPF
ncbi:E3 ubiquitin-protein ligase listerin (RING-type E3 ubiquitin transferase listerin) [Durusdinium trenchii]|uniref:E3 ubiquitin-protein ligase listerin n=1 Tax=Durusdinium trenchii TaxID=1381693 RepID=A0ABP0IWW6_9DINO